MLEKPAFSSGITPEVFEYKLFVSGKCGIGKTAAIAKLTANTIPKSHCETPGSFLFISS
jgi:nucleoside-triphosphatase THEP1